MSGHTHIKTFDRYSDDAAPPVGTPAASGVWAMRVSKFDAGAKLGFAEDNLRTIRALSNYRRKPGKGIEPFDVYISGNIAFEYVTSPADFDIFDGAHSPQSSTDIGANQVVVGPDAPAGPISGNPVLISGRDPTGALIRVFRSDPSGNVYAGIVNPSNGALLSAVPGAGAPNAGLQMGASDGANLQRVLSDLKGRLIAGESNRATYVVAGAFGLLPAGTAFWALEAGVSKTVRVRRIRIWLDNAQQTAAGIVHAFLIRTTAPSTGGSVLTPQALDPADGAFSGIFRTNTATIVTTPANPFTGRTDQLHRADLWIAGAPANVVPQLVEDDLFDGVALTKPIVIAPGVANGIAFAPDAAVGGGNGFLGMEIVFTEE